MPVCVAGMHRSGTSMVAKLLHLCGLNLGPEQDLMPPSSDNVDGFWENVGMVAINEEILNEFGGGWDRPPVLPEGWTEEEGILRIGERASEVVRGISAHGEPWGWKDPRNSLTLPFWKAVVPDARVVVCLRNPLEVALSLRRRNGFSYAFCLALWAEHYRRVLDTTTPEDRIVTHYDAYFHDPRAQLRRVLDFAGMQVPEETLEESLSAASTDLRHNRFTARRLHDDGVSPAIIDLYARLCREAGWTDDEGERTPPAGEGDETADEVEQAPPEQLISLAGIGRLEELISLVPPEREVLRDRLTTREAEVKALLEQLEGRTAEVQRAADQLERQKAELRNLREQLEGRNAEVRRAADQLERQKAELGDLRKQLKGRTAKMQRTAKRLERQEAEMRTLREQLAERDAEAERVAGQLAFRDAEIQTARGQLAEVQGRFERMLRRRHEALGALLAALPTDSTVIIAGEGEERLLAELEDLDVRRFPRAGEGEQAGRTPADGAAAIAHLEALRSEGADYLLFTRSAFWWLERYEKFRRYLENRYRAVVRQEGSSFVLFSLREPPASQSAGWRATFEEIIAECRARLEREPAILDWHTGLELESLFPQHTVFSTPDAGTLPYLDGSVDVVAVSSPEPAVLAEARRVAKAVVVTFAPDLEPEIAVEAGIDPGLVAAPDWRLESEEAALPTASIVIPTYNGVGHVETCLAALTEDLPPDFEGEIIVVDDASTDGTQEALQRWNSLDGRVKALRNPENAGFIASCNRGAEAAEGEIVVFLNNDTLPLSGWLLALLQTFRDHPDAGAVGGKLVYPDGTLQEAGGVMFDDGSAANFGRGDPEVDAPLYGYLREVDYCSGALLATRRSLFEEIGGFDRRYLPAYYEDTDYCFAVRERGFRVYYQPESVVVHFEGATSGTDLTSGVKKYQVINQTKFAEKWAHALEHQGPRPDRFDRRTWYDLAVRGGTPVGAER